MNKEEINILCEKYTKGSRIELLYTEDKSKKIGDVGVVEYVDDCGRIHVKWNNGNLSYVNPEEEDFKCFIK